MTCFLPNLNCNSFCSPSGTGILRDEMYSNLCNQRRRSFSCMKRWKFGVIPLPQRYHARDKQRQQLRGPLFALDIAGRICVSKRSIAVETWKWSASEPSQMSLCLWWPLKDAIGGFHELLIYLILRRFARILAATVPWTKEFFYGRCSWNALDV